ncbi:hypothetical protein JCM16163A_32600 [Paenibacillus sp. YK5]
MRWLIRLLDMAIILIIRSLFIRLPIPPTTPEYILSAVITAVIPAVTIQAGLVFTGFTAHMAYMGHMAYMAHIDQAKAKSKTPPCGIIREWRFL